VAFDGHKGRLWVVCAKCGRWNLVPFEDRWEALEECEKAYRGATQRASTGQIAMARLAEGTDLVRIGAPLRPEFAAWRYSPVLEARRRKYVRACVAGAAGIVAFAGGIWTLGTAGAVVGGALVMNAPSFWDLYSLHRHRVLTVRGPDGQTSGLTRWRLQTAEILRTEDGIPGLCFPILDGPDLILRGASVSNALPGVLTHVNQEGASRKDLSKAMVLFEASGGAEGFLAGADRLTPPWKQKEGRLQLAALRAPDRLALEMALNEDSERRALEGELHLLLEAWREAEELAGISDALTVPPNVEHALGQMKSAKR
jgi:hypothetical protein